MTNSNTKIILTSSCFYTVARNSHRDFYLVAFYTSL